MWGIPWLDEELLAFQERLAPWFNLVTELVVVLKRYFRVVTVKIL